MWSFVGSKRCTWWVWVALDAETRQVVAMMVGDRSEFTARCLWEAVPQEYRDGAVVFTDFRAAYRAVMPGGRHVACGKGEGLTNLMSSGSGARCGSVAVDSCGRPCRSRSATGNTSARCGTSPATTTRPYDRATTPDD